MSLNPSNATADHRPELATSSAWGLPEAGAAKRSDYVQQAADVPKLLILEPLEGSRPGSDNTTCATCGERNSTQYSFRPKSVLISLTRKGVPPMVSLAYGSPASQMQAPVRRVH